MIVSTLEFDVEALAEALSTQANSKVNALQPHRREARVVANGGGERALAIAAVQRQSDFGNERLQALIVAPRSA